MPSPTRADDPTGIAQRILVLRGQRVLLDSDLAELYGVRTERLNQQVRRNRRRFPDDFVIFTRINELPRDLLQNARGSGKHRDPRRPPIAFTEHGAIMAATVLNSPRVLERTVATLDARTRRQFEEVYSAIRALMAPPAGKARPIGFTADLD